jgi:3',5'-cyclic AMP phosphodiesterase CpdA
MSNLQPDEDLRRAVAEVNSLGDIDFVIVSGDISEYGDSSSLQKAKKLLDNLKVPYYITLGNHEVNWAENETANYLQVFGDDKFAFKHKDIFFIGFPTKPISKGGEGYILAKDIKWVKKKLFWKFSRTPIFAITHYPLNTGDVSNWQAMTRVLKKHNILAVISGHYHRNVIFDYDGVLGIVCRSVLRANEDVGAYIIFEIGNDITVSEKIIGMNPEELLSFPLK